MMYVFDVIMTSHICLQKLSAYNTRLFKCGSGDKPCYEVRLASAVQKGLDPRLVCYVFDLWQRNPETRRVESLIVVQTPGVLLM